MPQAPDKHVSSCLNQESQMSYFISTPQSGMYSEPDGIQVRLEANQLLDSFPAADVVPGFVMLGFLA